MTTADPPAPLQAGISRRHGCDFVPCCSGVVSGGFLPGCTGVHRAAGGRAALAVLVVPLLGCCQHRHTINALIRDHLQGPRDPLPPRPCNAYRAQAGGEKHVFPIRLDNRLLAGRRGASPWLWRARRTTQHNTADYATRNNSIQFPHVRLGCRGRRYIIAQRAADLEGTAEG